ncbi:MAG: site-2 protease family protein [Atopobiaceae bacterium]|nr:site-2 protease family protein [Atopobiaceae bacterium]
MSFDRLIEIAISVLLVTLSASFHEYAHALTAYKLGDQTAKEMRRLTPNPLAHIDAFGSLLLPLLMAIGGGPVFAYAKPVPYNPNRLNNPGRDDAIVAIAGPLSNLAQAIIGALLFRLFGRNLIRSGDVGYWVAYIVYLYTFINLTLMFFNLIPLPPLDGSKLVLPLLKGQARETYYRIQSYSLPILFVALYMAPTVFGIDPIGAYIDFTAGNLFQLLMGL